MLSLFMAVLLCIGKPTKYNKNKLFFHQYPNLSFIERREHPENIIPHRQTLFALRLIVFQKSKSYSLLYFDVVFYLLLLSLSLFLQPLWTDPTNRAR